MIECPRCKHQHFVGTLHCSECGARLVHTSPITTSFPREQIAEEALATKPTVPEGPELRSGALLGLRVVSTGEILSLLGRINYTLGRSIKGQAVIPDIDLSPFEAFNLGVSRLHAEMRLKSDGVYVLDLNSANGTLINGKRLDVLEPKPIRHGDIVQLGRLRLQLISRYRT